MNVHREFRFARLSPEARRQICRLIRNREIRHGRNAQPFDVADPPTSDLRCWPDQRKSKPVFAEIAVDPTVISARQVLNSVQAAATFGRTTETHMVEGIPYFTNQFWTSRQRSESTIHEVRASFNPSLPEFFIHLLSRKWTTVHDPFMGRGTVPLQAALMGRHACGSDINPISVMMTRPRFQQSSIKEIAAALSRIDWTGDHAVPEYLPTYFHPDTLRQIMALRHWLLVRAPLNDQAPDAVADWIRMAAMTRLTGHSAGFMSVITLPPNQMTTIAGQRRSNERRGTVPLAKAVDQIILGKSRALLRDGCLATTTRHHLGVALAWNTPWIADASVDLVLTSPPFVDVVDYGHENWMRGWFAGIVTKDIAFSHHASLVEWSAMIRRTLTELMRVVKPGGYIALEVGEVRRGTVDLERSVWQAAEGLPCSRLCVIVHDTAFTKSAHCYGVANDTGGTNSNRIVLMQRT